MGWGMGENRAVEIANTQSPWARAAIAGAMIAAALLGLITYAPAVNNKFVYDDYPIIVSNPLVNKPGAWYRFWVNPYWPRGTSVDKLYRPLTVWSFRANVVLAGQSQVDPENARAFHAVNIVLHALTSVGVALLAWRLTRRPWAAWLAGALFATHPLHTETVVTGYGRSELLAGLFAVWLMARYMRPWQEGNLKGSGFRVQGSGASARVTPRPGPLFHVLNAFLFLLAIMSKEHALFVWPVLFLYDVWRFRHMNPATRPPLRQWLNDVAAPAHAGFVLAIAAFFFLRFNVFGQFYWLSSERVRVWESPLAHANLVEHVLTPFRLLWLTLKLTVWPPSLCPVWSIPALKLADGFAPDVLAGMLAVVLAIVAAVLLWRRGSPMGAVMAGALILLAIPTQAMPMAHWLYAERWLYLPSVVLAVLVAGGLARLSVAGWALGLTAAVVLLPASWQYASRFSDNLTMAQEIVARQPDNFQGRCYLATHLCLGGDYEEAIRVAQETRERFESTSEPYGILVNCYLALGKGREALDALNTYEWIRRDIPEVSKTELRRRAEALIAQSAAQSRPATSSGPSTEPGG
jgi:protein O-mannosyl-transferase